MLGGAGGASENQAKGLLEGLVRRSLKTSRGNLFVIHGSKALPRAVDAVFGSAHPVQRCTHRKIEKVMGYLPEHLKEHSKAAMRGAFLLPAKEDLTPLEKQAEWLVREYPNAAASLHEGLAEMFTVSRLRLPPTLTRCLVSTDLIESPHTSVRLGTRKVCRWRDRKEDGTALGRRPAHDRT